MKNLTTGRSGEEEFLTESRRNHGGHGVGRGERASHGVTEKPRRPRSREKGEREGKRE